MNRSAEQLPDTNNIDYQARLRTDTETWGAEALHGSMRTSFNFEFDGEDLRAEDGGAMRPVFQESIAAARQIVSTQPNLLFELRRRLIEADEYRDMLAMARGGEANTMVVVSDFPPELRQASADVGGYNVRRQPAMLRVISRLPDRSVQITTQSLDGSDRSALEAIYESLGFRAQPGELLGQRLQLSLSRAEQASLTDKLTGIYDTCLQQQKGGRWHAGIRLERGGWTDTYRFVRQQNDLIQWFVTAKMRDPLAAESLRYKLAAALEKRYEDYHHALERGQLPPAGLGKQPSSLIFPGLLLMAEITDAALSAAATGKTFSGCGASVSAGAEPDVIKNQLDQSGYGNKTGETAKYSFDKKMYCVSCQAPPEKNAPKKMCGPCGLCRACDKKFGGKG